MTLSYNINVKRRGALHTSQRQLVKHVGYVKYTSHCFPTCVTCGGLEGAELFMDESCSDEPRSPPKKFPVPTTLLDSLASPPSCKKVDIARQQQLHT